MTNFKFIKTMVSGIALAFAICPQARAEYCQSITHSSETLSYECFNDPLMRSEITKFYTYYGVDPNTYRLENNNGEITIVNKSNPNETYTTDNFPLTSISKYEYTFINGNQYTTLYESYNKQQQNYHGIKKQEYYDDGKIYKRYEESSNANSSSIEDTIYDENGRGYKLLSISDSSTDTYKHREQRYVLDDNWGTHQQYEEYIYQDGHGYKQEFYYDDNWNRTAYKTVEFDKDGNIKEIRQQNYNFDENGNPVDAGSNFEMTEYTYNEDGSVDVTMTTRDCQWKSSHWNCNTPNPKIVTLKYDGQGSLLTVNGNEAPRNCSSVDSDGVCNACSGSGLKLSNGECKGHRLYYTATEAAAHVNHSNHNSIIFTFK